MKKFETKAVHGGMHPDPSTGAVTPPIYQTSTYAQEAPGVHKGYEYARTQNPTRTALEEGLATLENAKFGLCFASGMAAEDTIMKLLNPGDEVIATNDLYGGSFRLFTKVYARFGVKFSFLPLQNIEILEKAITPNTKMIWVGPPNWKKDTGINQMLLNELGEKRFYSSEKLKLARAVDGAHPTFTAARVWADSIVHWVQHDSKYRFKLDKAPKKMGKNPGCIFLTGK